MNVVLLGCYSMFLRDESIKIKISNNDFVVMVAVDMLIFLGSRYIEHVPVSE